MVVVVINELYLLPQSLILGFHPTVYQEFYTALFISSSTKLWNTFGGYGKVRLDFARWVRVIISN